MESVVAGIESVDLEEEEDKEYDTDDDTDDDNDDEASPIHIPHRRSFLSGLFSV